MSATTWPWAWAKRLRCPWEWRLATAWRRLGRRRRGRPCRGRGGGAWPSGEPWVVAVGVAVGFGVGRGVGRGVGSGSAWRRRRAGRDDDRAGHLLGVDLAEVAIGAGRVERHLERPARILDPRVEPAVGRPRRPRGDGVRVAAERPADGVADLDRARLGLEVEVDGRDADVGGIDRPDPGRDQPDRAGGGERASNSAEPFESVGHRPHIRRNAASWICKRPETSGARSSYGSLPVFTVPQRRAGKRKGAAHEQTACRLDGRRPGLAGPAGRGLGGRSHPAGVWRSVDRSPGEPRRRDDRDRAGDSGHQRGRQHDHLHRDLQRIVGHRQRRPHPHRRRRAPTVASSSRSSPARAR